MPSLKTLCIDLRWIDSSGVGVYIKGIMPGIVDALEDTAVVGLGDRTRLEEFAWSRAANVRLIDCCAGRYSLREQIDLPRAIPRETNLFFSPYYTTPLLYRGPLAVTVHDMSHLVVPEIAGNWKKRLYAKSMFRSLRKRASLIFTVSSFSKDELLRLTEGPSDQKIITTHLGISAEWYSAADSPSIRTRPYFVYVGNVKPYKNVGRLVEAFEMIRERIPHDLVIVGQSEGLITGESGEFFERIRQAGDRVHMTGFVSHHDLLSLVGHASALVMPSLYEGFGLPPVEAMASGVPVIVAHAGSLPEVCGDAAVYFDPLRADDLATKLLSVALDDSLSAHLRTAGAERSRKFTWQSCSAETASALRSTLNLSSTDRSAR